MNQTINELLDRSKGKKDLKCKFAKVYTNIWAWTLRARNVTVNQDQTASNRIQIKFTIPGLKDYISNMLIFLCQK